MEINPVWERFVIPDDSVKLRYDEKTGKPVLDMFWEFIHERQEIWYKRTILGLPEPWTEDEILKEFHFCNVYRELDRGTLYLIDNILSQLADDELSKKNVLLNIMIYRLFVRIETYDEFGFLRLENWEEDWERCKRKLRERRAKKLPVFTDAYFVNALRKANPDPATRGNKTENAICLIEHWKNKIDEIYENGIVKPKNMKEQRDYFMSLMHVGKFTAYEWCCDIAIAERFTGVKMVDWDTDSWTSDGPGARKGVDYIFADKGNMGYIDALFYLRSIFKGEMKRLGLDFKYPDNREVFCLRSIEHSACEFQKYYSYYLGVGRPKKKRNLKTKDVKQLLPRVTTDSWEKPKAL